MSAGERLGTLLIDTAPVPVEQQLSYWRDRVASVFGDVDIDYEDTGSGISGWLSAYPLGEVTMCQSVGNIEHVVRRAQHNLGRCGRDHVSLISVVRGRCEVRQAGQVATLGPGDAAMFFSRWPFELYDEAGFEIVSTVIPRALYGRTVARGEELFGLKLSAEEAATRILTSFANTVLREAPALDPEARGRLATILLELIAIAGADRLSGRPSPVRTATVYKLARLKTLIRKRLDDPELTREALAHAAGCSVREANRLFSSESSSISRFIRQARVERADRLLRDPACDGSTINEIAHKCGFLDTAQLSRAIRQQFGVTASERRGLRRQPMT